MIKDGLLAEFDHEMAVARRLIERVPNDRLSWKPHDRSRTFAALVAHVGQIPFWGDAIMNRPMFDLAQPLSSAPEYASIAEALAAFDAHVNATRRMLDRTDAEYSAYWSLRRGDQEIFTMPRVSAFRTFVLYHLVHHRGQLSVYLRLNGIPVPALYGPSADEG